MACSDKNSLIREGTAQYSRSLASLSPTFAQVDERNLPQLLLFVKRYAAHVTYFDQDNTAAGTWEPLIQRDLSIVLASLATLEPMVFNNYHKSLVKRIRVAVKGSDSEEAKRCFKFVFDLAYTLAKTIDEQCTLLTDNGDYQRDIANIIASKMDKGIRALLTFKDANLSLLPTSSATDPLAPLVPLNSSLETYGFHYIGDTPEPFNLTVPDTDELSKINFIVHHNLFQQQINTVLTATTLAIQKAEALFTDSLKNYDKHQPHLALIQAFLRLFSHAQYELNQYGKNHLEYYYKDVLQLKARKSKPDSAHLIIDLHKHVNRYLLKDGTLFKGGKDKNGKPLVYRLSQDVLLNQAKVAKVHSLHKTHGQLYATQDVDQASVFLFGDATAPVAPTGFAIASKLLLLKSGERTITVSIRFNELRSRKMKSLLHNITFKTRLTGEKGWIDDQVQVGYQPQSGGFKFSITVDGGKGAVQAYSEKIHQYNIDTALPLLMVYFDQDASNVSYDLLAQHAINEIRLSVEVQGYKDALLSNDVGLLDGSKPFKPFGDLPRQGAGFYIGSDELFQKPLTSLSITSDLPASFSADYLFRGRWQRLAIGTASGGYTLAMPGHPIQEEDATGRTKLAYGTGDRDGHIRLSLTTSRYSLSSFMDSLTQSFNETKLMKIPLQTSSAITGLFDTISGVSEIKETEIKKSAVKVEDTHSQMLKTVVSAAQFEGFRMMRNSTPTPPELVLDKFELNYSAAETIPFAHESGSAFFHLFPFGYRQIGNKKRLGLLPVISNNGELFIGLAGIQSPNTVSLLVEVVEGSSNPLKSIETVQWYYLDGDNEWQLFDKEELIDGTKHLTRTGIVTVSLPAEATLGGTVMPTGMLWVKVVVQGSLDAVCKLTSIRAQAAQVALIQDEEKDNYFHDIQPKGTISKLVVSNAAIKRIEQPSESFGGRPPEPADQFYTRVSERLRHKQRAITMWDYEHLVLEQFPSIYKAKCINRAGFIEEQGATMFCENYPGHVTLVTIPDISKSARTDSLRPYTPIGTLVDIAAYLENLKNPFIELHVRNPQFEEIQLEFKVTFHAGKDEAYHVNLLNDDIERFLCPWAFDASKPVSFGGKIHRSTLIDFIDERPYVQVLTAFKMHHIIRNEQSAVQTANYDVEEVVATSSRSVLVSYAEGITKHLIHVTSNCECV